MTDSETGPENDESTEQPSSRDEAAPINPVPDALGDLRLKLETPKVGWSEQAPDFQGALEEIAEDMLDLLGRMQSFEQLQQQHLERFDRLEAAVTEGARSAGRGLSALRRDLLGERKVQSTRHAFDAVVPILDSVRGLAESLDPEQDARMSRQLRAVGSALSNLLQGLGFEAFDAVPGEPFDPQRMECLGFADGEPGIVLAAVRPGYRAAEAVLRPAGVWIARRKQEDAVTAKGNER